MQDYMCGIKHGFFGSVLCKCWLFILLPSHGNSRDRGRHIKEGSLVIPVGWVGGLLDQQGPAPTLPGAQEGFLHGGTLLWVSFLSVTHSGGTF